MTEPINARICLERRDGAGIIRIDNPPINPGSHEVREGLLEAIRAVDADPARPNGLRRLLLIRDRRSQPCRTLHSVGLFPRIEALKGCLCE